MVEPEGLSSWPAPVMLVPFRMAALMSSTEMPRAAKREGSTLMRTADLVPNTITRLAPGRILMRWPIWVFA